MIELLALPCWQTPPRSLDDWVACLTEAGGPVVVERESAGVSWLEMNRIRLRGYAMIEGDRVEAINFELADPDPEPAARVVETAAQALGWELHTDDPEDDQDRDDD
jgi:hypothetical protein